MMMMMMTAERLAAMLGKGLRQRMAGLRVTRKLAVATLMPKPIFPRGMKPNRE